MSWLTGIVAIALMLAVLELDPSQLYTISNIPYQVGNESWQIVAYLFLFCIILLKLGGYVAKRASQYLQYPSKKPAIADSFQQVTPQGSTSNNLHLTPWSQLISQGLIKIIFKWITGILLLLAVLSNGVAQRLAFIESSPQQTLYVDAVVTPIGLSDKRLEVVEGTVLQGYRQLVALTDIKLTSINQTFDRSTDDNQGNRGSATAEIELLNPFNQPVPPEILNDAKNSEIDKLSAGFDPVDTMTVMLQSYQPKHLKLNELSADKQQRMKLILKPLQLKDNNNKDEFDEYRWLSSRHATAKAFIVDLGDSFEVTHNPKIPISELTYRQRIDVMRFKFREHFLQLMGQRSFQSDIQPANLTIASSDSAKTADIDSANQKIDVKNASVTVNKADP